MDSSLPNLISSVRTVLHVLSALKTNLRLPTLRLLDLDAFSLKSSLVNGAAGHTDRMNGKISVTPRYVS